MKLPLARPLTDAEAWQTLAVLALWVAFALAVPVVEQLTQILMAVTSNLTDPLAGVR